MARVGEGFPLECPNCGGDIGRIAFITEPVPIRKILTYLGERRTRGVEAPGTDDWDTVCADTRKTPPQGDARRFGEPPPDGRAAQVCCSRAVRQPEDRRGRAIDRASLEPSLRAKHLSCVTNHIRYDLFCYTQRQPLRCPQNASHFSSTSSGWPQPSSRRTPLDRGSAWWAVSGIDSSIVPSQRTARLCAAILDRRDTVPAPPLSTAVNSRFEPCRVYFKPLVFRCFSS